MRRAEMSDRQAQIIDTAMRLLATEGARRFTVARMAAEIGVTGGAIYRHFESMEAIVDAVVEHMEEILFEGFPPRNTEPLERLEAFFVHRTRTLLSNPHISNLLLSDHISQASGPAHVERLSGFKRRTRDLVIDCLREAQRAGALADGADLEASAVLVLGSILTLALANSRISSEARAVQLVERVWALIEYALRGRGPAGAWKKETKRPRRRARAEER
jgi:AcrR family transcriptional regulator